MGDVDWLVGGSSGGKGKDLRVTPDCELLPGGALDPPSPSALQPIY